MIRSYKWKVYNTKNTYLLSKLQADKYCLIQEHELEHFINYIPNHIGIIKRHITGITIKIIDDEIKELYFTYSALYYDLSSYYYRVI